MIIQVTMKTPDSLDDSIKHALLRDMGAESIDELSESELDTFEERFEHEKRILKRWFRHGEYVDIQFDTEEMIGTVRRTLTRET